MKKALWIASLLLAASGCSEDVPTGRREPSAGSGGAGGNGGAGAVGNPSGSGGAAGAVSPETTALSVAIEDLEGLELELITLRCAGDCADVVAVARGGHAPYRFTWEDGSTDAERTVCLDSSTTLEVSVTDTGFEADEFSYTARTVAKELSAEVLDCSDGGVPPPPDAGDCEPVEYDEEGIDLGEVTPDIFSNEPSFFAGGESLPPGAYSVRYVDGCLRYDPTIYFWAVNGFDTFRYLLIANYVGQDEPAPAPVNDDLFGAATYDECIELSQAQGGGHLFEHEGGPIGIYNNDFNPSDNTPGEGRNPTFTLARHLCGDPNDF